MLGFDEASYNIYYEKIIQPVVKEYQSKTSGLKIREDAKERIWKNYVKFNRHCREEYMLNPEKLTDRHKIIACYMYAIIKADILTCDLSIQMDDDRHLLLNERLAFCFGMTLLRSLIRAKALELKDETLREGVRKAFDQEPKFPNVNHGDYRDNLLYQLYYTKKECNYNILALADSIFFIENHNLILNNLPEDVFAMSLQ